MDSLQRSIQHYTLADYAHNSKDENNKIKDDIEHNDIILKLTRQIIDLQKAADSGALTLVLIDGDAMPFTDDLVFKGIKGGQEAARSLLRAAWNKVRYEQDFGDEDKMVVKVYANLKGLSQTYEERGTIKCCIELLDFVTGFNKTNEYCDYIDAGNAKEGADRKLKASLDLYLRRDHCKRIILGACTDSTYAAYLNSIYDYDVPSKVRLLKGPNFAFEFQPILQQYRQLEFPHIFRSEKIPSKKYFPRAAVHAARAQLPSSVTGYLTQSASMSNAALST